MSYSGDSYSAVQSAELSDRHATLDRGQRSLQMLLGVMQNRKALQQADQQFQQQHALALMQANRGQDELDWRKNLAEKELQAKASVLDFEKAKQATAERNFAQDANVRRSKEQRAADLIAKQDAETYRQVNAYAQLLNKKEAAQKTVESGTGKHAFWFNSDEFENAKKLATDLDKKLLKLDPKVSWLVVPDEKTGMWKPIIAQPQESQSGNTDSENSREPAGFNPLLRGSTPQTSDPAQATPQVDPLVNLTKEYVAKGMPLNQAFERAKAHWSLLRNMSQAGAGAF